MQYIEQFILKEKSSSSCPIEIVLLKFEVKLIRIPGVGGLCIGIFISLQGWLCVGVLCAFQCSKNSVGSGLQSHGCLYISRMFNSDDEVIF